MCKAEQQTTIKQLPKRLTVYPTTGDLLHRNYYSYSKASKYSEVQQHHSLQQQQQQQQSFNFPSPSNVL